MNGHYHRSGLDIVGGVARLDVNSATFNWIPNPHDLFPEKEWYKEYECIGNMVMYEDPISSVITIDTDAGFIDIEGTESRFLHGVTTELSGNVSGIRACLPGALSGRVLI
ncbi:MAG: hypothetical protein J6W81_09495, partial [Lentisphaeria bacterium]|nr:hypothetical protein [Lentisphaeria bacterium]